MKKITLTIMQLCMVLCLFAQKTISQNSNTKQGCAANGSPGYVKITSKEEMTVTGSFSITLNVKALDNMYIDSLQIGNNGFLTISANSSLSKNQIAQSPHFGQTYLNTNQTTTCNLIINHATSNLPYYPEDFDLKLRCHTATGRVFYLTTNARIYFTPYNSVEIWDVTDFMRLPRIWAIKQNPAPPRISVARTAIPVSTRPNSSAITAEWQKDFQTERVPGLPYLIQMAAAHPDTIKAYKLKDSMECVAGRGGLGKSWWSGNTFKGQVKGRIKCSYTNDEGVNRDLFLSGIRIAAYDEDGIYDDKLGETHTNENGYFEINYNDWQSGFEGDYIELFVQLWSENVNYDLDVISDHAWTNWFNITYSTHFWFGDTDDDENRDLGDRYLNGVDDGPYRTVHFASNAYRLCRANLPQSASPDGLNIFLYNEENTSYYVREAPFHNYISLEGGDQNHESIIYHEFGHFLMHKIQNNLWPSNTGGEHFLGAEIHPSFAWTEGWATGIEGIFDSYYRWQDEEHGWHGFAYGGTNSVEIENRRPGSHAGATTSGFKSEYFISTVINDLYDGASTFPNTTNVLSSFYDDRTGPTTNNGSNFANGQEDDVSLSLYDICLPLMQSGRIDNIYSYYSRLINSKLCFSNKIKKLFIYNGITRVVNSYDNELDHMSFDDLGPIINVDGEYMRLNLPELDGPLNNYNLAPTYDFYESTRLTDNLVIRNGATLFMWGNAPTGLSTWNLPPPLGSSTTKFVESYKAVINVEPTSSINVGGVNPVVFRIKCDAIVRLKNNSNLNVTNNSSVVVDLGGTLIFEKGAKINLIGANSLLIVKPGGKIQIGQDAVFTYTGDGFIRLETGTSTISANAFEAIGSNAQVKIIGGALGITSKKVLEITGNGFVGDVNTAHTPTPSFNLAGFSIQNAHIALAANANLNIGGTNTKCDFRFMDIRAIIPNDINNRHRGITVNGQNGNMFYKVNVNDAKTGITSRNFYGGADIDILQVNATRCGTAIYVEGKGARIQEVNINACDVGIWLVGMNRSTRLHNPILFNNKTSVYAFNCASNVVEVYKPHIHSSIYGLVADNSRFSVMCGIVKNNSASVLNSRGGYDGANVYLKNNANFIADPVMRTGSGKTDIGNWRSIAIQQQTAAYGPYIYQGSNSLFTDIDYSIYGTLAPLRSIVPASRTYAPMPANNNLWRRTSAGISAIPTNTVDYLTKYTNNPGSGAALLDLTYLDPQPLPFFSICSPGPAGGSGTGTGAGGGERMRGTIIGIVTPIKDLPNKPLPDGTDLKNKIQEGYQYFYDMVPNHALAVSNLTYALNNYNYNPGNFTPDDLNEWSIALMEINAQLIEALSEGLAEENITKYNGENTNYSELVQGVISLQDKLLVDFTEDALNTFTISMNKAALLRMLDDRAGAIQTVSGISAALYPELNEVKESFLCMTTKEQNLIDGSITQEQFNAIECSNENFASLPDPYIDTELVNGEGENERNIAGNQSIINPITVYPNPSKGVFGLKFKGEEATFYEIEVFDILGAKVASQNGMNLRENNVELNLSTLPSGTYFLRFVSNKEVQLKKLVITK